MRQKQDGLGMNDSAGNPDLLSAFRVDGGHIQASETGTVSDAEASKVIWPACWCTLVRMTRTNQSVGVHNVVVILIQLPRHRTKLYQRDSETVIAAAWLAYHFRLQTAANERETMQEA